MPADAGREGELIFRYYRFQYAKANASLLQRLWLQSMTPAAIRDDSRPAEGRRNDSCSPRGPNMPQRGAWTGHRINGTRAIRRSFQGDGGFHLTTCWSRARRRRGQFSEREATSKKFLFRATIGKSRHVRGAEAGRIPGRWFDEKFFQKRR